jgi:large subunit ribosomal protein L4
MPEVDILDSQNKVVSQLKLNEQIFDAPVKEHLVHEVVRMQLASRRAGAASTRNRALVRGSGAKPWRQKGTGRSRAGTRQSPLWRGGGVIFGPSHRDFGIKVNRKVRRAALRAVLTQKLREGHLKILENLELPEIKTKRMIEILDKMGLRSALVVIPERDEAIEKSAQNIPSVQVITAEALNVYDVLRYEQLVIVKACLPSIEQWLVA